MSFKKNNANRFLAGLLAVLMIVSMLPISAITAFAMSEGTTYTFTVTDGTVAIENATITFSADGIEDIVEQTDSMGVAEITVNNGVIGTYKATKLGYKEATGEITAGTLTDIAVVMDAIPTVAVSGSVKDANDLPLENATIAITGYNTASTSTDVNGAFSVQLYEGQSYTATVKLDGYKTVTKVLDLAVSNDFVLEEKTEIADFKFNVQSDTVTYGFSKIYTAKSETYPDAIVTYKSSDSN